MTDAIQRLCVLMPSHWEARAGGAEMQVRLLVERLSAIGKFDIHCLAREVDESRSAQGYTLHRIPQRPAISGTFLLDVPATLSLLQRLRPHAIYQRVGGAYTFAAAYFARSSGARAVWHVSSDRDLLPLSGIASLRWPLVRLNRAAIDYGARHASAVIVQTLRQAALLRERYGRCDAIHIPNFHPLPQVQPLKANGRFTVCWIGNIKPLKQLDVFLRLAHEFRARSDVEFVVVGGRQTRGDAWAKLEARMRAIPALQYLGPRPESDVEELLRSAHVLVNTSTVEGFPNTFIQAWLREVAVVSLSVNPDGVFDGNQHGICAQGDYDRLKQALDALLADGGLREQIAQRSSTFARQNFSLGNIDRIGALLAPDASNVAIAAIQPSSQCPAAAIPPNANS